MNASDMETLQLALLQQLNDVDGVCGIGTESDEEGQRTFVIFVVDDECAHNVTERLDEFPELPPWRLETK